MLINNVMLFLKTLEGLLGVSHWQCGRYLTRVSEVVDQPLRDGVWSAW